MASLAASLLAAPGAHAGTYSVSYSGGTYNYYGTPPVADTFFTSSNNYGPAGNPADIDDASGQITAKFTWQPASGKTAQTDPPPPYIIIAKTCTASYNYTWYNVVGYVPPTGYCDEHGHKKLARPHMRPGVFVGLTCLARLGEGGEAARAVRV